MVFLAKFPLGDIWRWTEGENKERLVVQLSWRPSTCRALPKLETILWENGSMERSNFLGISPAFGKQSFALCFVFFYRLLGGGQVFRGKFPKLPNGRAWRVRSCLDDLLSCIHRYRDSKNMFYYSSTIGRIFLQTLAVRDCKPHIHIPSRSQSIEGSSEASKNNWKHAGCFSPNEL